MTAYKRDEGQRHRTRKTCSRHVCVCVRRGLVDNDHDPFIAHPPTEDHPLADSLVLSLAVQELLIIITTQSGANESGWGRVGVRW